MAGILKAILLASSFAGASHAETFRDWEVSCVAGTCRAAQTLSAPDRTWLATLEAFPKGEGATLLLRVPLGVHLASGVFVSDGATTLYPATFTRCETDGCRAVLDMTPEMLAGWRKGTRAQIRYRPSSDAAVLAFEASLMGVTQALSAAGASR